jgi:cytochrome P450
MEKPISDAMELSHASLIELLIAHIHKSTGNPPTIQYLTDETFTFIDAGVDTSGRTLAAAIYYILRTHGVEEKLRAELHECSVTDPRGDHVDTKRLNNLEYLVSEILTKRKEADGLTTKNAIIKETHRMWPALPGPLPRIVPAEGLKVGDYYVPPGVRPRFITAIFVNYCSHLICSVLERGIIITLHPPLQ